MNTATSALAAWRASIHAQGCTLERAGQDIDAKETQLLAIQSSLDPVVCAARWQALAAERNVLAQRWADLKEEKVLYGIEERKSKLEICTQDFEPGGAPIRDVWCAVVTHQFDMPCFSCCFQR